MAPIHHPVLAAEAVGFLDAARGGLFVDCTVGLGGHTLGLLERGAYLPAFGYIGLSLAGSLALTVLGLATVQLLQRLQ